MTDTLPADADEAPTGNVDGITLAVIGGALESTVRQMTITMERTCRSAILNLGHDYSNAVLDGQGRLIVQGQDLPIHLGGLIFTTRTIARFFEGDINPGDVFYHNDPVTGGSHYPDMSMLKPVFLDGELLFWVANKAHMPDPGGPVAGGYNPDATESYAEGLRITPVRLADRGRMRDDVLGLITSNTRNPAAQRHDMLAQLAALTIAERNLLSMLERYGPSVVKAAGEQFLDIAESNMRAAIQAMPDGAYDGMSILEGVTGAEDLHISCRVTIAEDHLHVSLSSPPQVARYTNSYYGNTISAVYSGILTYAGVRSPFNEGLYRAISVDLGPAGTVVNARNPAPAGSATTSPGDNITEAVRYALSRAVPERAVGAWSHCAGTIQTGIDPRSEEFYGFPMVIGTSGGAGATYGLDGWPCLGSPSSNGALQTGDIELLELDYPIQINRYELREDSGGPGRWRGGLGAVLEVEPLNHDAVVVAFGDGYRHPAPGVLGAGCRTSDRHIARKRIVGPDGALTECPPNSMNPICPGQVLRIETPGGGGVGSPFERDPSFVARDVHNGLVSIDAAREEYGVVLHGADLAIDEAGTDALRGVLR